MRVAMINPQGYGNLQVYDNGLIRNLGDDIDVFYYCNIKAKKLEGLKCKHYFTYKTRSVFAIPTYILNMLRVWIDIYRQEVDIVHIQWAKLFFFDDLCMFFFRMVVHRKCRLVYTAHNLWPHKMSSKLRCVYKYRYWLPDVIIVHDQETANKIIKLFPRLNVKVVPAGATWMGSEGDLDPHVAAFCDHNAKKLLTVIGAPGLYKNTELLISAWLRSRLQDRGYYLVLAGAGYENTLKGDYQSRGIFWSQRSVSDRTLRYICERSFGFLLPYSRISQSGVLLTVTEFRKPILCSKVGALGDFVKTFKVRVLADIGSTETLAGSLNKFVSFYTDNNFVEDWGDVDDKMSWDAASKATRALYCEVSG